MEIIIVFSQTIACKTPSIQRLRMQCLLIFVISSSERHYEYIWAFRAATFHKIASSTNIETSYISLSINCALVVTLYNKNDMPDIHRINQSSRRHEVSCNYILWKLKLSWAWEFHAINNDRLKSTPKKTRQGRPRW